VTRFGEAIYLRAIGYRSPLLLAGKADADGFDAVPRYRVIRSDFQQNSRPWLAGIHQSNFALIEVSRMKPCANVDLEM